MHRIDPGEQLPVNGRPANHKRAGVLCREGDGLDNNNTEQVNALIKGIYKSGVSPNA